MDLTGKQFSHYRGLRRIGAGGMGEIYLAHDTALDRKVAIKVLPVNASDPERIQRLTKEAKAASAVNHPNICVIHEVGQLPDGRPYIVMEYIEGKGLDSFVSSGMPIAQQINIAIQVADALHHAHGKGVIHRDIKPSNIIVTHDHHVKIVDFGLAKLNQVDAEFRTELPTMTTTNPGQVMGTIPYMSPEQLKGEKVDHRSDIFSFGVSLYQMAIGQLPFRAQNSAEMISQILHAEPQSVSHSNPEIPNELENLIRKCLEKDPERRYQSVREISIDLKNLKRNLESDTFVKEQTYSAKSSSKKFYWIGLSLLLVVAAVVFYLITNRRSDIGAIAVLPFQNLNNNAAVEYLSDGITETMIDSLSQLRGLRVMARSTVFAYKGKRIDPGELGKTLKVDALVTGNVLSQGQMLIIRTDLVRCTDGSLIWGQEFQRPATELLDLQADISEHISDQLKFKISSRDRQAVSKRYTENEEAYKLYLRGRSYLGTLRPDETYKAMSYFQRAIDQDPKFALAYSSLASCHIALCISADAPPMQSFPRAKELSQKALAIDNNLGHAYSTLSAVHFWFGWDWKADEDVIRLGLQKNPNDPNLRNRLAHLRSNQGRHTEAISEKLRALEFDPLNVMANSLLGQFYLYDRRYDLAIDQLNKTLQMNPNFWHAQMTLGKAYEQKKMYDIALKQFETAQKSSSGNSQVVSRMGHVLAITGRKDEARKILKDLLELAEQRYVSPYSIAMLYEGLGETEKTFEWLRKAFEQRDVHLVFLRVEPIWDSIRNEPRFQELQNRIPSRGSH